MWHNLEIKPEPGRKIVALYNDGSGATLFFVHDGGLLDSDGNESDELNDEHYGLWAYLPDGMKLWCEVRWYEQLTLSDPRSV